VLAAESERRALGRHLLTVKQFSQKHQAWTEGALRALIFDAEPRYRMEGRKRVEVPGNGLASAIVRIGRSSRPRVLLDEERFFEWVDEQQAAREEVRP
jgi:hypothetical protein